MDGYQLTAIIERIDDQFIARCLELDIESRGITKAAALANLTEAVGSFVANAEDAEIVNRLAREVEVALFEVRRR